jgi:hypothetical protein
MDTSVYGDYHYLPPDPVTLASPKHLKLVKFIPYLKPTFLSTDCLEDEREYGELWWRAKCNSST